MSLSRNVFFIVSATALLVGSSFAARGDWYKPVSPWIGTGYFNGTIPKPTDAGITRSKAHGTFGAGVSYMFYVNKYFDFAPSVSYMYSARTDLTTNNYRWRYWTQLIPVEASARYHIDSKWSLGFSAGVSYVFHKLSYALTNSTVGGSVVDLTGVNKQWKPTFSLRSDYMLCDHLSIGLNYRYLFANTPKAFTSTTTSDVNAATAPYRRIPSQQYLFLTLGYTFS